MSRVSGEAQFFICDHLSHLKLNFNLNNFKRDSISRKPLKENDIFYYYFSVFVKYSMRENTENNFRPKKDKLNLHNVFDCSS